MTARQRSALHDPETDLPNRELFLDRLELALFRSFRYPDRRFAVLSVAVEQHDSIEAAHGYEASAAVLKQFADRLVTVVRNYDSLAHIDRGQFAIMLESIRDVSDPARVAARLHDTLRTAVPTRWGDFMLSASVGIVLGSADVDSAGRLMQLSGLARLRAASTGAPYEIYDPAMQEQARARLARETELRRAVQHNQFSLYYQPIVSLETGRIVETEALLRWRHPQRGVVNAGEFIGLAEEMGLTVPLGWFALDAAVRQLQAWSNAIPANGSLPISINMTAAHFRQPNVPERIGELLRKAGVTRGVNLEVTESLLINDATRAAETLAQLRQLGIGIHLDDFGTGYSSLQYLHELPFDAIKIDRSFIARLSKGGRDSQIVATIRELARQLGIPVIAEGVETQEHLTLVRALGCEFAQGYFFARPMPPDDVANLVLRNPTW